MSLDLSVPNPARIYDYLLGGDHNFPVDREVGKQVERMLPGYDVGARRGRECLCKAVTHFARLGHKHFMDFASGLPTQDNVHSAALAIQPDARIMYSDIDGLTMAYALEILGRKPGVRYIHCDAAEPEQMTDSHELRDLFRGVKQVAITYMGISYFLSGAPLRRALRVLYDWADPGTHLALGFVAPSSAEITLATKRVLDLYQRVLNVTLHLRTPDEIVRLAGPWQVRDPGILPYDVYLGATESAQQQDPAIVNIRGHIAFFIK